MNYAVIMAGGTGKRLWPLSRKKRPKQVLKLFEGETLLGRCYQRLAPIFEPDKVLVLTNAAYVDIVRETLPDLPAENVIAEPMVRDTAGAIGLAASVLLAKDPQANMAVVTADQIIDPPETFQGVIKDALHFVDQNPENLVTFGIKPTFAATVYGYIKCQAGQAVDGCTNQVRKVDTFVEKPDKDTAQTYLDDGNYFWNSGLFVWKAKTIYNNLSEFLPDAVEPLQQLQKAWGTADWDNQLKEWFAKLPKISIDFAVMEKATKVNAIELDCQWFDMGSFNALADIHKPDSNNNILATTVSALQDANNNVLVTEEDGHMIAVIGVDNLIVAHSPDATFVCPLDQIDKIKGLLDQIEQQGNEKYL